MLPESPNTNYTTGIEVKSADMMALQAAIVGGQHGFTWHDINYSQGFRVVSGTPTLDPVTGLLTFFSGDAVELDIALPRAAHVKYFSARVHNIGPMADTEIRLQSGYRRDGSTTPIGPQINGGASLTWTWVTWDFQQPPDLLPYVRENDEDVVGISLVGFAVGSSSGLRLSKLQIMYAVK